MLTLNLIFKPTQIQKILLGLMFLLFFPVSGRAEDSLNVSCPKEVSVNLDFKGQLKIGQSVNDVYFSPPVGWSPYYTPGPTIGKVDFKTAGGASVNHLYAGLKDIKTVPFHDLRLISHLNGKKTAIFNTLICRYLIQEKDSFTITLSKDLPETLTCQKVPPTSVACYPIVTMTCPLSKMSNEAPPRGWLKSHESKTPLATPQKLGLCNVMPVIAVKSLECRYCGRGDYFTFIKTM